jgi:signal transduction histidine kinase
MLAVSVRDSGVGIEDQDPHRIFHAFYTSKTTGVGRGLAFSRSIVEAHGGRLWVSPNEGPGTCCACDYICIKTLLREPRGHALTRPCIQ